MKLKCIGGPRNGYIEHVRDEFRIGDMVQVREPRKISVTEYLIPYDKIPEMTTDILHNYILDTVAYKYHGATRTIKFLRYVDLELWEAVRIALSP